MMDRNQWTDLALLLGLHHYFFLKGILGSLYDHKESGTRFNVSPEGRDTLLQDYPVFLPEGQFLAEFSTIPN